jgi:uncharacterized membrane protein
MNTHTRIYIIFVFFVTLWCVGIIAAPALKHTGNDQTAGVLYSFFSRICHQIDARSFHIDGEKFGVCIRCSAIYFGFLVGLLLAPIFGLFRRIHIPKQILLLITIVPMLIDVVLNDTNLLISTTMTRIITGALFGSVTSWYVIALFIESCLQIIQQKKNHSQDSGAYAYVRETK